jgi:hypothetical protein
MTWTAVKDGIVVPARPQGIWTWVFDFVRGPALIRVEANGSWSYSGGRRCGPDGDLNALLGADHMILAEAPVGALLVKVGGSTAGVGDGHVRVAGSAALVQIDATVAGPIFLTINDEPSGLLDNAGDLTVKISIAQLTDTTTKRPPDPPVTPAPADPTAEGQAR